MVPEGRLLRSPADNVQSIAQGLSLLSQACGETNHLSVAPSTLRFTSRSSQSVTVTVDTATTVVAASGDPKVPTVSPVLQTIKNRSGGTLQFTVTPQTTKEQSTFVCFLDAQWHYACIPVCIGNATPPPATPTPATAPPTTTPTIAPTPTPLTFDPASPIVFGAGGGHRTVFVTGAPSGFVFAGCSAMGTGTACQMNTASEVSRAYPSVETLMFTILNANSFEASSTGYDYPTSSSCTVTIKASTGATATFTIE